jgi:hypothetical protein
MNKNLATIFLMKSIYENSGIMGLNSRIFHS